MNNFCSECIADLKVIHTQQRLENLLPLISLLSPIRICLQPQMPVTTCQLHVFDQLTYNLVPSTYIACRRNDTDHCLEGKLRDELRQTEPKSVRTYLLPLDCTYPLGHSQLLSTSARKHILDFFFVSCSLLTRGTWPLGYSSVRLGICVFAVCLQTRRILA